ncbi:MAG: hypothetical protein K5751_00290, partial [Treponemataceae bacterium]|nr:hypothetical protein [Treponemataceae bacterium]
VILNPSKSDYSGGEIVEISAVPESGYMFRCWNDGNENPERILVMNENKNLSAEFIRRNWTIVMYMAADNDLESAAILDINEMEAADFKSGGLTVLALIDRAVGYDGTNGDWTDTRLYEIVHDEDGLNGNIISKRISCNMLGLSENVNSELNMSDPNVLRNVLNFATKLYPATNYGLVIWGHGTGWRGVGSNSDSHVKAFAVDDYSSSYMTLSQMHEAISASPFGNSGTIGKLGFLGFDTCYGALLETAWEFRNDAKFMVGSENSVPSNGWNYQSFLNSAASRAASASSNPEALSPETLAGCAKTSFAEQYRNYSYATISVINLSNLGDLKQKFENFSELVVNGITSRTVAQNVLNCVKRDVQSFSYVGTASDMFVDMYSFVKKIYTAKESIFDNQAAVSQMEYRQSNFVTALNKAVSSWSGDSSVNAKLGIYFSPVSASGEPIASFSTAYVKNSGDLTQSAFVKDSVNWVPTKNRTDATVLNKIFFTDF